VSVDSYSARLDRAEAEACRIRRAADALATALREYIDRELTDDPTLIDPETEVGYLRQALLTWQAARREIA
jgi:hypothetical protein